MEAQNPASGFRLDASKNTHVKKRPVSITNRFREDMVPSCTKEVPSTASSRGYKQRGEVHPILRNKARKFCFFVWEVVAYLRYFTETGPMGSSPDTFSAALKSA